MELSHLFSELVLLVSVIHLAHTIGSVLWAHPGDAEVCREDRPLRPRDDWYLFFHCSALWGTDLHAHKNGERDARQIPQATRPGQPPRPRPRAGAACSMQRGA